MSDRLPELLLAVPDPRADPAWLDVLSSEEQTRRDAFLFEKDRLLFRTAHALVRHGLSRHGASGPAEWRFRKTEHGRPELEPGQTDGLRFNLSHTQGLVALLIHGPTDAGVDVERVDRKVGYEAVARFSFAPAEVDDVLAEPLETRRDRFFAIWTLKEAYIKARGLGLFMDLSAFAFSMPGPGEIAIRFEHRAEDDPGRWRFDRYRLGEHALAIAVADPAAPEPTVFRVEPATGAVTPVRLTRLASSAQIICR